MAGYGTDIGFTAYLAENGYSLPSGAAAPAVLRQRGSAYVDSLYGARFTGLPTGGYAQDRAWPRTGAEAYGSAIPSTEVPVAVEHASYAAGYQEAVSPGSLSVAVSAASQVKREKIGPIEVEYVTSGNALDAATTTMSAVEGLLAPFLTVCGPAIFVV